MNPLPPIYPLSRNSTDSTSFKTVNSALLALTAAVALSASPAQAANLLVNPSFEQNSGHAVPVGWTRFEPPTAQHSPPPNTNGNFWIEAQVTPQSGSLYYKEWGACYNATNNEEHTSELQSLRHLVCRL